MEQGMDGVGYDEVVLSIMHSMFSSRVEPS